MSASYGNPCRVRAPLQATRLTRCRVSLNRNDSRGKNCRVSRCRGSLEVVAKGLRLLCRTARGGLKIELGVVDVGGVVAAHFVALGGGDFLAAGEARVGLVPVLNLALSDMPAQVDPAT